MHSIMETLSFPGLPPCMNTAHLALFVDVTNAPEIRQRLITAAKIDGPEGDALKDQVDFAFVEGSVLVSCEHLVTALLTTLLNSCPEDGTSAPRTSTHNLHSELLLHLSPNTNISDSIKYHGLSDKTRVLVVVRLGPPEPSAEEVWRGMDEVVDGRLVAFEELEAGHFVDWPRVDKIYKLSELQQLVKKGETESQVREKKKAAIVSTMAIKHVT